MSKRRSKKRQETEAQVAPPAPPPKILGLLGDLLEEPNVVPPPKTVASAMRSAQDTVPALPLEEVYADEKKTDALPPEIVTPSEQPRQFTVLADETTPCLSSEVLFDSQSAQPAKPARPKGKRFALVFAGLGLLVIAGGITASFFFTRSADKPAQSYTVEREQPPLPEAPEHSTSRASIDVRPRFALPPPVMTEANAELDVTALSAMSLLNDWLNEQASGNERDLASVIRKTAMAIFGSRFGSDVANVKSLEPPARTVAEAYRTFFQEVGRTEWSNSTAALGQLIAAGERLGEHLAQIGGLETRRVVLCRNVSGFGRYELFTEPSIRARYVPLLQVYVEFANPKAEIRDDGRYVYRLSQDIKMRSANKEDAAPLMDTTVSLTELSLSPRKDFFSAQYLRPTQPIPPGDYVIEVSLSDQIGQTTAKGKARLSVVSD